MLLTAKLLLTLVTLGYSAIPSLFDFNNTHATNPSWTGHARYHVVWQVVTFDLIAVLALALIWTAGADASRLWVPVLLALFAYGGFWTANVTRPLYRGVLQDPVKGCRSFTTKSSACGFRLTPTSRSSRRSPFWRWWRCGWWPA